MANITSVSPSRRPPSTWLPIALLLLGVVTLLCALSAVLGWLLFPANGEGADVTSCIVTIALIGIALVACGVVVLKTAKTKYVIRIRSASSESDGLTSTDQEYVARIVDAMNEAIVNRG